MLPMRMLILGFVLVAATIQAAIVMPYLKLWLYARRAGRPIGLPQIFGLTLMKVSAKQVVLAIVSAHEAGVTLTVEQVANAYLQGVDVEAVTSQLVAQTRRSDREKQLTFEQLAENDLKRRPSPSIH